MADDNHSSHGGRRKPVIRGPFVVTNPNNDSDDENNDRSNFISPYVPPPLPSNSNPQPAHSPYPQQPQPFSVPSTSSSNKNSYEHIHTVTAPNGSNPSLSSPSGSSSPNVESTPPPSTPGLSTQQSTVVADDAMPAADRPMLDSRNDVRQYDAGARVTMMDKFKQHLPGPLRRNAPTSRVMPVRSRLSS